MMEVSRLRRFSRSHNSHTILPLRVTHISNTISCWYCDFKSTFLNDPLFRYGRKHSRWLRVWFSVGIGFSLSALVGVTMILLWELGRALRLYDGDAWLSNLLSGSLFGIFSPMSGLSVSLPDLGCTCISTVISVLIHEFGHVLAAARVDLTTLMVGTAFAKSSEGLQMEYIAVFLAVLFPGALVAFNHELLQCLPRIATLRIYCGGIWHNAVFAAGCAVVLFLLPLIFCPFYVYGESPMVLGVSPTSPLFTSLSPGDVIFSIDGKPIHDLQDWRVITALLNAQALQYSNSLGDIRGSSISNSGKGYCVPFSLIEDSSDIHLEGNQTTCPNELSAFAALSCSNSRTSDDQNLGRNYQKDGLNIHCLNAKDIVKLQKCGDGWAKAQNSSDGCLCSKGDFCLTPIEIPGSAWVEITYMSSSSPRCRHLTRTSFSKYEELDFGEISCINTFVYVGDVISMLQSLYLTPYRPRWSLEFGQNLPNMVEKLLMSSFQVSTVLALLNSIPVYFLDGESILEVCLQYFRRLNPRMRKITLHCCLLGGTLSCMLVFLQFLFDI